MATNISSIPVLDFTLTNDLARKAEFIGQLRYALINVGFLYLKNHSIPQQIIDNLITYIPRFFDLPQETKNKIFMVNSPHFLGYSKLGGECTTGKVDFKEQFVFATPHETQWKPGALEYLRMWGPCQWPDEQLIPGFRNTMETYLDHVKKLSYQFIGLLAEALGLPSDALNKSYDADELVQHRAKVVKYPANDGSFTDQGIGAHYDPGFLTFLLQASPHPSLQVQNLAGEWIDVSPIPGTFVVNPSNSSHGVSHVPRTTVSSLPVGSTARYPVPFFQSISLHARLADEVLDFPPDVLRLKAQRDDGPVATDSVHFMEFDRELFGKINLIGRVKSHPDVAEHHYPDLFKGYFPNGLPRQVNEY